MLHRQDHRLHQAHHHLAHHQGQTSLMTPSRGWGQEYLELVPHRHLEMDPGMGVAVAADTMLGMATAAVNAAAVVNTMADNNPMEEAAVLADKVQAIQVLLTSQVTVGGASCTTRCGEKLLSGS